MIYLLKRLSDWDYEEYSDKVVRATSELEARKIANEEVGEEGKIWEDPTFVRCDEIDPNGPSKELLARFHAG